MDKPKLTKEDLARLPEVLRLSYALMTAKDKALLDRAADVGILERFWDDTGAFGFLFTRYRITDLGRQALEATDDQT